MHLHNHVQTLYDNIRKKALVQYFSPFLTVDMNKMARSFSTTVSALEKELAKLITTGHIQARIDSHNKVFFSRARCMLSLMNNPSGNERDNQTRSIFQILCAKQQDQRSNIFIKSLRMGNEYESNTNAMLLRMNLLKSNLVVTRESR